MSVQQVLAGEKRWGVAVGDCRTTLSTLPAAFADAVATDPPYEFGFMGKDWDRSGVAFDPATWAEVLRCLKPGGYMVAFAGARTQHRIACAIEDGGFQIRDCLLWLYGTGFPKGKGCLKPAYEPIILARRPGPKVLPLGIDDCRVNPGERVGGGGNGAANVGGIMGPKTGQRAKVEPHTAGRYPANVLHDGSEEVLESFAAFGERTSGKESEHGHVRSTDKFRGVYSPFSGQMTAHGALYGDSGSAARFFFCAKASQADRGHGNTHPTVKPTELMRWLVKLISPNPGVILDPFAGSGTTLQVAVDLGHRAVGCELSSEYAGIITDRMATVTPDLEFAEVQ